MVVTPHERRTTNEVVCEAHGFVHPRLCGHGTMIATVLDGQPYPSTSQPCMRNKVTKGIVDQDAADAAESLLHAGVCSMCT